MPSMGRQRTAIRTRSASVAPASWVSLGAAAMIIAVVVAGLAEALDGVATAVATMRPASPSRTGVELRII
ncbi:hypothetical protein Nm8I071_38910 [Nonomuraea sp. TT08I-71]|nr:hypothetical protein Nm8I071_38910 [Nonomuraea sp. TT08I-71]